MKQWLRALALVGLLVGSVGLAKADIPALLPGIGPAVAFSGFVDMNAQFGSQETLQVRYYIRQSNGNMAGVAAYQAADGSGFAGRIVPAWSTLTPTHASLAGVTRWQANPATFRIDLWANPEGNVQSMAFFVRDKASQKVVLAEGDAKSPVIFASTGRLCFGQPEASPTSSLQPLDIPAGYLLGARGEQEQISAAYVTNDPLSLSRVIYVKGDLGFVGTVQTVTTGDNTITMRGATQWQGTAAQFELTETVLYPAAGGLQIQCSLTVRDASTQAVLYSRAAGILDADSQGIICLPEPPDTDPGPQ